MIKPENKNRELEIIVKDQRETIDRQQAEIRKLQDTIAILKTNADIDEAEAYAQYLRCKSRVSAFCVVPKNMKFGFNESTNKWEGD